MGAIDRVRLSVQERQGRTLRVENNRTTVQQSSLYDGGGRYKPLGAASGIPSIGLLSTGGLAIGEIVAVSQGLAVSRSDTVSAAELRATAELLDGHLNALANQRGIQVINGDPNAVATQAFREYPFQILYSRDEGVIYYNQPGTATVAESWEPIFQYRASTAAPVTPGRINGAIHAQIPSVGAEITLYYWRESTSEWLQFSAATGGGAIINYVAGPPPNPAPASTVNGQGHHDTVVDRLWTYDLLNTTWRPAGNKHFFQGIPTTDPNSFARGDKVTLYETSGNTRTPCDYIWSDQLSDWLLTSCCPGCAEDFFNSFCDDDEGSDGGNCTPLPP